MKRIGSGVQFIVYDLENGRVAKKPTTFLQKLLAFHRIAPKYHLHAHPIHNIKTSIGAKTMTRASLAQLRENLVSIDATLLGNPSLAKDGGYEQDKVLSFGEQIRSHDLEGCKILIDKYLDHILSCWDYGFSDTVFNFMVNSGVTAEGAVILIDLGELTWDKDEIAELVRTKHWEKRSSYNKLQNVDLKAYTREQFNKKMTLESLDQHWRSNIRK